jgi:hypothetical protein
MEFGFLLDGNHNFASENKVCMSRYNRCIDEMDKLIIDPVQKAGIKTAE